jgi:ribulose-5-phosphate 4-epimerase/fuculose-1-phosphate aldolase
MTLTQPDTSIPSAKLAGPPVFASVEDERLDRKQRLAAAFRVFAKLGFDDGLAGHITVRDPGNPETFWVNPLGLAFAEITVSDLLCMDANGTVIAGSGPLNDAAFFIHSHIHRARPDVIAAAHSHSPHGKAWSALARPLDPITQDAAAFFEVHSVDPEYNGPVLDPAEGVRIAETLGPHNRAMILRNHGLLAVGRSVDEAAARFIAMERACQVQLLAEAAGNVTRIRDDIARVYSHRVSTNGFYAFAPQYRMILREQPDLLG